MRRNSKKRKRNTNVRLCFCRPLQFLRILLRSSTVIVFHINNYTCMKLSLHQFKHKIKILQILFQVVWNHLYLSRSYMTMETIMQNPCLACHYIALMVLLYKTFSHVSRLVPGHLPPSTFTTWTFTTQTFTTRTVTTRTLPPGHLPPGQLPPTTVTTRKFTTQHIYHPDSYS